MSEQTFQIPQRHQIIDALNKIGLKTGDIIFRLSATTISLGIPFSAWVAKYSASRWSHAAMIFVDDKGQYWAVEVNARGTVQERLIDWFDYCADAEFEIKRYANWSEDFATQLMPTIQSFLDADADYDATYSDTTNKSFYCTKSVAYMYQQVGVTLCQPQLIKDIIAPKWLYWIFAPINALLKKITGKGFNTSVPVYFAGDDRKGLCGSSQLVTVVAANPVPSTANSEG